MRSFAKLVWKGFLRRAFFLNILWYQSLHPLISKVKVKVAQSCLTLCDPMDSTGHQILQGTILEWVAFLFSRESSQPRDQTQDSHIAGSFFTSWATRGSPKHMEVKSKSMHLIFQLNYQKFPIKELFLLINYDLEKVLRHKKFFSTLLGFSRWSKNTLTWNTLTKENQTKNNMYPWKRSRKLSDLPKWPKWSPHLKSHLQLTKDKRICWRWEEAVMRGYQEQHNKKGDRGKDLSPCLLHGLPWFLRW